MAAIDQNTQIRADGARYTIGTGPVIPPSAPASGYTEFSNLTEARTLDADSTTLAEVADVLGTLIEDLKVKGFIAA